MPLRTLGALALATTLALSACSGDDPEPTFAPEPTGSTSTSPAAASPTASPTSPGSPPTLPELANSPTPDGGRAFVSHWIRLLNYATESGTTTELLDASAERCGGCHRIIDTIEQIYAEGGTIDGGTWGIERQRALPLDRGADYAAYVEGRISGQTVQGVEGRKDATFQAGPGYMYAYAALRDGGWQMVFLEIPL